MNSPSPFLTRVGRFFSFLLLSSALVLPSRGASVDYVVQVSLDGLGAVYLQEYVTTAPEEFPNFVRLMNAGAFTFNARCDFDFSETVPNHITMFTGRPVLQPQGFPDTTHHGYNNNFPQANDTIHANGNPSVPYKSSMFDVAHDYGLTTAFHASKTRLEICNRSYNEFNGALDLIGEDNGPDKIDLAFITNTSGTGITNEVNELIDDLRSESPTQYSFIHISEPDLTGHGNGWNSEPWRNAVRLVDSQLGRILDVIETQPLLQGKTALVVTADHGGGGVSPRGHTEAYHINNYTIPFFVVAPTIPGGTDLYSLMNNRGDPGTNRTDYTTVPQPIRDGDASNLALALLGLPPIPDSFMIPDLLGAGAVLTAAMVDGSVLISWNDPSEVYVLEQSATACSASAWTKVTDGIMKNGISRSYRSGGDTGPASLFFRLRRIGFHFTSQPASQTVHAGTSTQLQVDVSSGSALTFQWYQNNAPILGAKTAQLDFPTVDGTQAGVYFVEVSDGVDTLRSEEASLTVLFQPVITQQPEGQIVQNGTTASFSVQAQGAAPLSYQWQKDGVDLPGAIGTSLNLGNVTTADEGSYVAVVSDQNGTTASEPATLSVLVPITIVQQPTGSTNQVGDSVTFSVSIEGNPGPFTYSWRKFPSTIITTITSDLRSSSLTLANLQLSDAGSYLVTVTSANNPNGVVSFPLARLAITAP